MGLKKSKHMIAISVDALHSDDLESIRNLYAFQQILKTGAHIKEMIGVYPSLTYPTHASILTGTFPDRHGIFANEKNQPGRRMQDWYWHASNIKVPTIADLAVNQGLKVGALFWPVMAGANIHYNIPEIWPTKERGNQLLLSLKNGTPLFLLDCFLRFGKKLKGKEQPNLDEFTTACATHMITSKKPNLLLVHLIELDHHRHVSGQTSRVIPDILARQNRRIHEIIHAVKAAGIYEDTTFFIFGDHGFLDFESRICINTLFVKENLITLDDKGAVLDWKAYVNSCDGSAFVTLKNSDEPLVSRKVEELLNQLKDTPGSGLEAFYTKKEAAERRVTGAFEFMLEAKQGHAFSNDWTGEYSRKTEGDYMATHGYDPLRPGYSSLLLAFGAGIREGVALPSAHMVDIAPTMAHLLNIKMPPLDGRIIDEILL